MTQLTIGELAKLPNLMGRKDFLNHISQADLLDDRNIPYPEYEGWRLDHQEMRNNKCYARYLRRWFAKNRSRFHFFSRDELMDYITGLSVMPKLQYRTKQAATHVYVVECIDDIWIAKSRRGDDRLGSTEYVNIYPAQKFAKIGISVHKDILKRNPMHYADVILSLEVSPNMAPYVEALGIFLGLRNTRHLVWNALSEDLYKLGEDNAAHCTNIQAFRYQELLVDQNISYYPVLGNRKKLCKSQDIDERKQLERFSISSDEVVIAPAREVAKHVQHALTRINEHVSAYGFDSLKLEFNFARHLHERRYELMSCRIFRKSGIANLDYSKSLTGDR